MVLFLRSPTGLLVESVGLELPGEPPAASASHLAWSLTNRRRSSPPWSNSDCGTSMAGCASW